MKVSITVPTFNQGPFIDECLGSIQAQTYPDLEVIIQDSESKDETQKICEGYAARDPRFKYYREKDTGQSDAINRGLKRSNGELWTWICSDDYYADPKAIHALVAAFQASPKPQCVGVYGKAQLVSEKSVIFREYGGFTRDLKREDFKLNWPLSQPSSILDLSAVRRIGGVKENLHLGMDLDLFIRLLDEGKQLTYVPTMVASVRLQPDSKSVKFEKMTAENALAIVQEYFGDTQDLFHSAYGREIRRIKRQAQWNRILPWIPKPLQNVGIAVQKNIHDIVKNDSELSGAYYEAIRFLWDASQHTQFALRRCVRGVLNFYQKIKRSH